MLPEFSQFVSVKFVVNYTTTKTKFQSTVTHLFGFTRAGTKLIAKKRTPEKRLSKKLKENTLARVLIEIKTC